MFKPNYIKFKHVYALSSWAWFLSYLARNSEVKFSPSETYTYKGLLGKLHVIFIISNIDMLKGDRICKPFLLLKAEWLPSENKLLLKWYDQIITEISTCLIPFLYFELSRNK